jgi:hypothetical protein
VTNRPWSFVLITVTALVTAANVCVDGGIPFGCYLQRSLATDLHSLSIEFRKKQSSYLKQLRQQKEVCHPAYDVFRSSDTCTTYLTLTKVLG